MKTASRDVSCRALESGGSYMLTQPGQRPQLVTVFEDENTTDLWIVIKPKAGRDAIRQRIDELAEDVCFHRVSSDLGQVVEVSQLVDIDQLLRNAAELRKGLESIERLVADAVGCQMGEGSVLADAVLSAVRDGIGSSIELLDLAGKLRR